MKWTCLVAKFQSFGQMMFIRFGRYLVYNLLLSSLTSLFPTMVVVVVAITLVVREIQFVATQMRGPTETQISSILTLLKDLTIATKTTTTDSTLRRCHDLLRFR